MIHRRYRCTAVYDDFADNDEVYAQTTAPLVRWVALGADGRASGRRAGTVVLFGQTGTGKTFTAQAVQQRAAEELFAGLAAEGSGEARVELSFYEMCGSSFFDLLNARAPLSVLTDGEGHVHVRGASSRAVSSAAALQEAAEEVLKITEDPTRVLHLRGYKREFADDFGGGGKRPSSDRSPAHYGFG